MYQVLMSYKNFQQSFNIAVHVARTQHKSITYLAYHKYKIIFNFQFALCLLKNLTNLKYDYQPYFPKTL